MFTCRNNCDCNMPATANFLAKEFLNDFALEISRNHENTINNHRYSRRL
jgi:hypothetical protein